MSHEHAVATQRHTYSYEVRGAIVSAVVQACKCGARRKLTVVTLGAGPGNTTTKYTAWKSGQSRRAR